MKLSNPLAIIAALAQVARMRALPQLLALLCLATLPLSLSAQPAYPWQKAYSEVLPQGGLKWTPEPFAFEAGSTVRYIDFEKGSDDASGESKDAAWKHHPWDTAATGKSKAFGAATPATYVFKRGSTYRGRLVVPENAAATPDNPVRLTSDPSWGTGEAVLSGAERITGWTQGAHPGMPDSSKVWKAEIDFLPRTLWLIESNCTPRRLKLARHPNWNESDPNDLMSEWPVWENPEWWKEGKMVAKVEGKNRHKGVDRKNFTRAAADYQDATVWTEWGIVMGSPYPARVEAFDEKEKYAAFRGPWTWDMLEKIITGNRYHLENKAWMLDEPGEFWVERKGKTSAGTLYVRLPGDASPASADIEAGRRLNMIEATILPPTVISGLTFRYNNVHWDYFIPSWAHPDLKNGAIRWTGRGSSLTIRNCVFEHVTMALRASPRSAADSFGTVAFNDNQVRDTDHGAVTLDSNFGKAEDAALLASNPLAGRTEHVDVLRNKFERIGMRIISGEHGHCVDVRYPVTSHLAGNHLHRIAGWGLAVFGGKPSSGAPNIRGMDVPFSRHLIHHNRVEDVLLKSNDWGGIETWQGGPFYVFNNVVINALGFKNWTFKPGDTKSAGSFGHAYYLDGSFKNYLFNNIAAGRNNTIGTKGVNITGLQNIFSFENWFFHNTFFKFAEVTRQQEPSSGRSRYLANVFDDATRYVFRHTNPKDDAPDPNASHYTQGGTFDYPSLAYAGNVFHKITGRLGGFEETGFIYDTLEAFSTALGKVRAQAASTGTLATSPPLRDPAQGDFRPAAGSAASGQGFQVFVPWGLSGVVGEWDFVRNAADPARVLDGHWSMTPAYAERNDYGKTRRYPLTGTGITAENYIAGPLNSWNPASAASLDGKTQHFSLAHSALVIPEAAPPAAAAPTTHDVEWARIEAPATMTPGAPATFTVTLKQALPEGEKLFVDVHWLAKDKFGGVNAPALRPTPVSDNPLAFRYTFTPKPMKGLARLQIVAYTSAKSWNEKTRLGRAAIDATAPANTNTTADLRTVDIGTGNLLIEAYIQTTATEGTLVRKMDQAGYVLDLDAGRPRFTVKDATGATLTHTGESRANTGKWVHLLAELDRGGGIRIYQDGKTAGSSTGPVPTGSLANSADFLVGGGPGATPLAARLVARGTLADARTTIGELHAWQFDGPQFRDFAGNDRRKQNAAGALTTP